MLYSVFFCSDVKNDVEKLYNVIRIFNNEIILISFDTINKTYEIIIDIKFSDNDNDILKEMKRCYAEEHFNMYSVENYIENYTNIYVSDSYNFSKIYIYARNAMNKNHFDLNDMKKNILDIAKTVKEKSEIRIWNQQFKQYFKQDYSKFLNYCIDRTHWEVDFNITCVFEGENELEILKTSKFDFNEDELCYNIKYTDEDEYYNEIEYQDEDGYSDEDEYSDEEHSFNYDDFYDELEKIGIDNY